MHKITFQANNQTDPTEVETENGLAIDESLLTKHAPHQQQMDMHPRNKTMAKKAQPLNIVILIVAILAGLGTGYGVYASQGKLPGAATGEDLSEIQAQPTDGIKVGDIYGSPNEEIFKDSAEGVVQKGGLDAEGSHSLIRPGGASQTVYMTSTSVDLDQFEGAKVKVWGETFEGQKAGWLMDVGRIKVLELNAQVPTETEEE